MAEGPEKDSAEPSSPGAFVSLIGTIQAKIQALIQQIGKIFSIERGNILRDMPSRMVGWFKDLPSIPKLVIAGVVLLILLVTLSPVAVGLAALALGVSIIALIIRVTQRGSLTGWGIAAVASLVMMLAFGGISESLYGSGFAGSPGTERTEPPTPKEKIESALRSEFDWQLRDVKVQGSPSVGFTVDADFDARCGNCSDAQFVRTIEKDMRNGYRALYTSDPAPGISEASLTAYHEMVSKSDGSTSDYIIFSTTLLGTEARDLHWENASYIDFGNIWAVEEVYPNYDPLYTSGPAFDTGYDGY
jgi:hypothetical protein